jgi:hypothetical protein
MSTVPRDPRQEGQGHKVFDRRRARYRSRDVLLPPPSLPPFLFFTFIESSGPCPFCTDPSSHISNDSYSRRLNAFLFPFSDHLVLSVRLAHPGTSYHVVHSENLVGLFTCIFVKVSERASIKDAHPNVIKRGMRGNFGNKVRQPPPPTRLHFQLSFRVLSSVGSSSTTLRCALLIAI